MQKYRYFSGEARNTFPRSMREAYGFDAPLYSVEDIQAQAGWVSVETVSILVLIAIVVGVILEVL